LQTFPTPAPLRSIRSRAYSVHERFEVPKFRESAIEKASRKTTQLKVWARFSFLFCTDVALFC
jgi:hypothetical protein